MKRFEYRLARVRDLRRRQMEEEEAKLQQTLAEEQRVQEKIQGLAGQLAVNRDQPQTCGSVTGYYLATVSAYGVYLDRCRQEALAELEQCKVRVAAQWDRLREARQRLRLLETLEQHQRLEWQVAADREWEQMSSELYLARWKSPSRQRTHAEGDRAGIK